MTHSSQEENLAGVQTCAVSSHRLTKNSGGPAGVAPAPWTLPTRLDLCCCPQLALPQQLPKQLRRLRRVPAHRAGPSGLSPSSLLVTSCLMTVTVLARLRNTCIAAVSLAPAQPEPSLTERSRVPLLSRSAVCMAPAPLDSETSRVLSGSGPHRTGSNP